MEGQKAFEEPGKASSFTTAFVDALREGEGVSYRILFHQVTESKCVCVCECLRVLSGENDTHPIFTIVVTFHMKMQSH